MRQDRGCWMLDSGFWIQGKTVSDDWMLDAEFWMLDSRKNSE